MTLRDQQRYLELFHSLCVAITKQKGPDYAPDGIPLMDLLAACVDANIPIHTGLWVYLQKHLSAVRRHCIKGQPLSSEALPGRLHDAANYLGFIMFWEYSQDDLVKAWRIYWESQACECYELDDCTRTTPGLKCQRCETLSYLDRQGYKTVSTESLSDSTPRVLDLSHTVRRDIGDTIQRHLSRSASATPRDTKRGCDGKSIPPTDA
jgi:hypothetical protein